MNRAYGLSVMKISIDKGGAPALGDNSLSRVYDAGDLAQHFHVDTDTISAWARNGVLPPPLPLPSRKRRWAGPVIEAFLRGEAA